MSIKIITAILFIFSFLSTGYADNVFIKHNIKNFSQAKKHLKKIYKNHSLSFYCSCNFYEKKINNQYKLIIDNNSCEYITKNKNENNLFIEWEHILPASSFAKNLNCWNEKICTDKKGRKFKGRKCCTKVSDKFNYMEADLHNIVPALSEINRDRSNYKFDNITGEKREYGKCNFEVDKKNKIAEPDDNLKGFIARAYLYMNDTYNLNIFTDKEIKEFQKWDKQYMPNEWELKRNDMIKNIQGNSNKFIDKYK